MCANETGKLWTIHSTCRCTSTRLTSFQFKKCKKLKQQSSNKAATEFMCEFLCYYLLVFFMVNFHISRSTKLVKRKRRLFMCDRNKLCVCVCAVFKTHFQVTQSEDCAVFGRQTIWMKLLVFWRCNRTDSDLLHAVKVSRLSIWYRFWLCYFVWWYKSHGIELRNTLMESTRMPMTIQRSIWRNHSKSFSTQWNVWFYRITNVVDKDIKIKHKFIDSSDDPEHRYIESQLNAQSTLFFVFLFFSFHLSSASKIDFWQFWLLTIFDGNYSAINERYQ